MKNINVHKIHSFTTKQIHIQILVSLDVILKCNKIHKRAAHDYENTIFFLYQKLKKNIENVLQGHLVCYSQCLVTFGTELRYSNDNID